MSLRSSLRPHLRSRRVVALATAGALLAGGGSTAVALALSGGSAGASAATELLASTGSTSPAPPVDHGILARLARLAEHAVHAQVVVVQHGTTHTWTFDRGRLAALSSSSLQVAEADGQTVTIAVSSSTKVLPKRAGGLSGLKTGTTVDVLSEDGTAVAVLVPADWDHTVRGTISALASGSVTVTTAKGAIDTFSTTSTTRVLPSTVGGLDALQDGQRVAVRERDGQALSIRVLPARPSSTGGGSSGDGSAGTGSAGTGSSGSGAVTASVTLGA
ncbi:hypothetical protein [Aciditerrimonas ferrireducens]|uniref:hypothetical protein n=1 Tax=Aciditerrimonas ferrireducens TaxID=667306 RepID=UPI002002AA8B|nr:hypothetical protein [Aciditerrimonas ferrireducens]MCK4178009.1 hypothetical protein [Aciditerrimonas ferrireducens]